MRLMTTSKAGIDLIRQYEGCRLQAYKCPAGVWTIGYGHTQGVRAGQTITQQQAEEYLRDDIAQFERHVNGLNINLRQPQFDALVSWLFNLGIGNFQSSTLRKYIVERRSDTDIAAQFIRWVNAGGKPLLGLKRRRVSEVNLWMEYEYYRIDGQGDINVIK